MAMLQELHEELQEAHPKAHRRPSGLTVVDSVDSPATQVEDGSGSWCDSSLPTLDHDHVIHLAPFV